MPSVYATAKEPYYLRDSSFSLHVSIGPSWIVRELQRRSERQNQLIKTRSVSILRCRRCLFGANLLTFKAYKNNIGLLHYLECLTSFSRGIR